MFRIGCEVYGGATGHRHSFLKENEVEMIFETRDATQAKLPEGRTNQNGVCFNYWIEECS